MLSMTDILPPFLALAAVAYVGLAIRVARTAPHSPSNPVSFFLVLMAGMVAGAAFSYGATDARMFGIGRVLTLFSSGFVVIIFYVLYREYTVGRPGLLVLLALSVVPIATTGLAMTNPIHNMVWTVVETHSGPVFTNLIDHDWYRYIFAPFAFGLIAYSVLGLILRLPSIAPAHRRTIGILLACAVPPYLVAIANMLVGVGPAELPLTSLTVALMWPGFAWVSLKLRVHDFSPLAYKTLFDHVRDPIFVIDKEQRIICANKAGQELLGCSERGLVGSCLWEDFPEARAILEQARELDLTQTLRMDTKNIYEVSVGPLTGSRGQDLGMVVVCRDVTERRTAQNKLAESEHLVRTLIETSSNGILRFAHDANDESRRFRCVFANRAAEVFAGDEGGSLVGMPLEKVALLEPERLLEHFSSGDEPVTQISYEVCSDGEDGECWLRVVAEPVGGDFSVTVIDITQRKRTENKMMADALRDPLTSVLNRRGFEQEAASAIRRSSIGAVLYLDLNQFKSINDRFGHQAGDALLKAFGHRLEFCLRPEDILGRLGGDEFAIVLPGVVVEDVMHIAERLIQTASEAYIIQGQEIQCTASVGIALMPKHGEELWHLLSVADQAMYAAKSIPAEEAANDRAAYVEAATAS
jgi:diguanylate cyclase (GGDEF)-like protein/PAS domain S-box-containing protein